jgi:hypothetical protein
VVDSLVVGATIVVARVDGMTSWPGVEEGQAEVEMRARRWRWIRTADPGVNFGVGCAECAEQCRACEGRRFPVRRVESAAAETAR